MVDMVVGMWRRTFGGEGFHMLRDELMPPPTPLSHRDMAAEGPRCCVGVWTSALVFPDLLEGLYLPESGQEWREPGGQAIH